MEHWEYVLIALIGLGCVYAFVHFHFFDPVKIGMYAIVVDPELNGSILRGYVTSRNYVWTTLSQTKNDGSCVEHHIPNLMLFPVLLVDGRR